MSFFRVKSNRISYLTRAIRSSCTVASWTTGQRFSRLMISPLQGCNRANESSFVVILTVVILPLRFFCVSLQLKRRHLVQWRLRALWGKHDVFRVLVQSSHQLRHTYASGAFKGRVLGYFPVSKIPIKVAPSSQSFAAPRQRTSVRECATQWWYCFAQRCKISVNDWLPSTASTYSLKCKHLCKCAFFYSSRFILLFLFITFARLRGIFFVWKIARQLWLPCATDCSSGSGRPS